MTVISHFVGFFLVTVILLLQKKDNLLILIKVVKLEGKYISAFLVAFCNYRSNVLQDIISFLSLSNKEKSKFST